jgi:hypothetical protein
LGFVIIQEEDLAAIKIKVYLVAVKADLGSSSTEMVIGVVTLITNTIKIIEEFIVFIGYKVSNLEVFRVTITEKVRVSVKIIRQQR